MKAAALVRLYGVVQGVGFRFFAQSHAYQLSLTGFARNEDDGSLTVYVEGEREAIARFIDRVIRGPRLSRVTRYEVSWREYTGKYGDFYVERWDQLDGMPAARLSGEGAGRVPLAPGTPSVYLLFFRLGHRCVVRVRGGREFKLEPGSYVYVGSAKGTLRARLIRHFGPKTRYFWNVDYLTGRVRPITVLVLTGHYEEKMVAMRLSRCLGYIEGFGNADDKKSPSHLFFVRAGLGEALDAVSSCLLS